MAQDRQAFKKKIYTTRWCKKPYLEDGKEFNDTLTEQDINTELYTQVANSPDINLLDLEFFRAIQSFNDAIPKNKEELIQVVSMAYDNYPEEKLNHIWLTLQSCFNQIILNYRDNDTILNTY